MTTRRAGAVLAVLALGVGLAAPAAAAQGAPRVTAQLSTGVAKLGSTVSIEIAVAGVEDARLLGVPRVDGLAVEGVAGPSVSVSQEWTNRRRTISRSISWRVVLRPAAVGEYTIPPIRLTADGDELLTRELTLKVVEDLHGMELGYLELVERPARVIEGQPFVIDLRLGWDQGIDQKVNMANLILPWWGELPGTLEVSTAATATRSKLIQVNLNSQGRIDVRDLGTLDVRGRPFRVLRLRRTFIATRPGPLAFPESFLEFGFVGSGFFDTRKETYHVGFPAFELEVEPLPEKGRPFDFSGAVGSVRALASVDRRDVEAGESIKFSVEWFGEANLEFLEPPDPSRLGAFDRFRLYGTTDRFSGDRRRIVYDLAPISGEVTEIPSLPLSVYDPAERAYVTVETEPIAIRVRALAGASTLAMVEGADGEALALTDIQTASERDGAASGPTPTALGASTLAVLAAWLAARTTVRRRGDPDSARARARRGARRGLVRDLRGASGAGGQATAVHRFLAARTGRPAQAWEGSDPVAFARALEPGGGEAPPQEGPRELAAVLAELEARHWDGDDAPLDSARLIAAAERAMEGGF
ncbi:MAG: BatD family protein [Planctomycetota bacterium]|nr:BatD family protein [Planctomycetota bacterium]MDP6990794.1 BatD family protein [Planctomycetota bacterium]